MVKRYRKKKTYRRKRRFSRRKSLVVRPDGLVKEKVTISHAVYSDTSGSGYLNVHWFKRNITGSDVYMNVGVNAPANSTNT